MRVKHCLYFSHLVGLAKNGLPKSLYTLKGKCFFLFLPFLFFGFTGTAQAQNKVYFKLNFDDAPLELNETYFSEALQDSVVISALKFYVGKFHFFKNGKLIKYSSQYFLVDAAKPASMQLELDAPKEYDAVHFYLGVDSATNNSGAMAGALDPMHNMYWTWQSGYINFKLEGTSPSCPAKKNKFQFHVGGYLKPYNSVVKVELVESKKLKAADTENDRTVILNLNPFFSTTNIRESYQIMSPKEEAVKMAEKIATLFMLTP